MKFLIAGAATTVLAAVALVAPPARAEVLDLSTITCKQFFEGMKSDEVTVIISWLHGYYREEKDPPVIDTDKFKSDLGKFGTYCGKNPTVGIITAADQVLGK
jgi:acid stress chaperone HdeB